MSSVRHRAGDQRRAQAEALLRLGTCEHYEDTALYDHEYAERTDDVRWYRSLAADVVADDGGQILELGAGTGRITAPLAADGHHVVALDRMPSMLDALRRRIAGSPYADRIRVLAGDMREIAVDGASVDLVIAPFNSLMHLYTWTDLVACFREVRRVLRPYGIFAFDVQLPDLDWLLLDPDERHAVTRFVHPVTGERLIYSTNHRYDPATQICHIRIYYDEPPPRGKRLNPTAEPKRIVHLAHRQIYPEELRALVDMAGLSLTSLTGDFSTTPLRGGHESQVAVCMRPGGSS